MSYLVIARKWRPQSFEQLVGQTHISQTLHNALKNNRIPHALLFTGPRGTGKTSSARILAKNLRCPNAVDFVACNVCRECQDIAQGRSVDVVEIDGASNNGVDAIRDLRDTVAFMPSSGKYKVYIIDEVHMLSTSAFNALLKTLEEPPAHVIFIMATTEVHKIPQTILSRCQRFDFRTISTRQITDRLKYICEQEQIAFEEEALWIIARQGAGSMRDSQSLLDQVVTFSNGQSLTRSVVVDVLGLTDRTLLLEALSALINRDTKAALDLAQKTFKSGSDPHIFSQDLLECIRNLLFVKISGKVQILDLPESELLYLKNLANVASEEDIHLLFDMILKGAQDVAKAFDSQIVLEMLLLRVSQAPRVQSLMSLLAGQPLNSIPAPVPKTASALQSGGSLHTPKTEAPERVVTAPPVKAARPLAANPQEKWLQFVGDLKQAEPLFAAKVERLLFVGEQNKTLELAVPANLNFLKDQLTEPDFKKKLQNFVDNHWGQGYAVHIDMAKAQSTGTSAQAIAQEKQKQQHQDLTQQVSNHPLVKSATAALHGQVGQVRNVKKEIS